MNSIDPHDCPAGRNVSRQAVAIAAASLLLHIVSAGVANAAWPHDPALALPICTAPDDQENPRIIPDGAGGAIICWTDRRLGYPRLGAYAQRVDASGTVLWTSNGISLYVAGTEQAGPMAASDGAGGAIIFYLQAAGVDQFPDLYAQRLDASGALRWAPSGVLVASAPYGQYHSAVVPDGAGGAIVAWMDGRFGGFDVFVQRVSANGQPLWAANGEALTANTGGIATFVQMVPDDAGGAILAWWDSRNYFGDIYAQRIDAQGRAQWASNGIPVSPYAWGQSFPSLAADGAGGAIVCWQDDRNDEADLYAQRVAADGTLQWGPEGVPVCTMPNMQSDARIIPDGSQGALITWIDFRNIEDSGDVYCQRLSGEGLALWASNGIPVCMATGLQFSPVITTDGAGGAIISWGDQRHGDNDVYAQHIDGAGIARWEHDGIPVASVPDDQTFPQITSDFAGGAFVVWPDRRNTVNYDIYANRLSPPTANAGGAYSGQPGEPIAFNGAGSTDPAGDSLTFQWDFGDGTAGTRPTPTHTYAEDGVYEASLTVSDGLIAVSDTATVTIASELPPRLQPCPSSPSSALAG